VNEYEILLMLDPEAPTERHDEVIARTRELVEKTGGSWVGHDPWGRRRLAYPIEKKEEGVYHLLSFDSSAATLVEAERVLKITDIVMRHLATRRGKPQPASQRREGGPSRSFESAPPPGDSAGGAEEYAASPEPAAEAAAPPGPAAEAAAPPEPAAAPEAAATEEE
jgi:small subunit ribosomal protein S6